MSTTASVENYNKKKQQLAAAIKTQAELTELSLQKDTSNLFRHRNTKTNKLDVRAFNHVIRVDPEKLVAEVEGMTTYEALVAETLKYGCLPTVVPELKSITIGGALSGIGIESSSFKYGLVHETISQFDVLLPNGEIVDCRPDNEHKDLYYSFANSYGSLGYALKVTVKLIPAKKYVALEYQHFSDDNAFFSAIEKACNNKAIDYVDGVIFSKNEQVLITGNFTDQAPFVSNYKFMKIYYQALRHKKQDYLTALDYIWRWDPDWFWCSKVFGMQNPVLRFLIGKWLLNSVSYSKIMRFAKKSKLIQKLNSWFEKPKESVIQDVAIPIQNTKNYIDFFRKNIGITPVWVCPTRRYNTESNFSLFKMEPNLLYVNFGFWAMVPSTQPPGFLNKKIETKVKELGGNKSLYSNVYYTEDEFWKIHDKAKYTAIKNKYDPDNRLTDLYKKCTEKNDTH